MSTRRPALMHNISKQRIYPAWHSKFRRHPDPGQAFVNLPLEHGCLFVPSTLPGQPVVAPCMAVVPTPAQSSGILGAAIQPIIPLPFALHGGYAGGPVSPTPHTHPGAQQQQQQRITYPDPAAERATGLHISPFKTAPSAFSENTPVAGRAETPLSSSFDLPVVEELEPVDVSPSYEPSVDSNVQHAGSTDLVMEESPAFPECTNEPELQQQVIQKVPDPLGVEEAALHDPFLEMGASPQPLFNEEAMNILNTFPSGTEVGAGSAREMNTTAPDDMELEAGRTEVVGQPELSLEAELRQITELDFGQVTGSSGQFTQGYAGQTGQDSVIRDMGLPDEGATVNGEPQDSEGVINQGMGDFFGRVSNPVQITPSQSTRDVHGNDVLTPAWNCEEAQGRPRDVGTHDPRALQDLQEKFDVKGTAGRQCGELEVLKIPPIANEEYWKMHRILHSNVAPTPAMWLKEFPRRTYKEIRVLLGYFFGPCMNRKKWDAAEERKLFEAIGRAVDWGLVAKSMKGRSREDVRRYYFGFTESDGRPNMFQN